MRWDIRTKQEKINQGTTFEITLSEDSKISKKTEYVQGEVFINYRSYGHAPRHIKAMMDSLTTEMEKRMKQPIQHRLQPRSRRMAIRNKGSKIMRWDIRTKQEKINQGTTFEITLSEDYAV